MTNKSDMEIKSETKIFKRQHMSKSKLGWGGSVVENTLKFYFV